MATTEHDTRSSRAWSSFWRLIVYLGVAGVVMVAAALTYLSLNGPLTTALVLATSGGVFISIVLGGGLMAAGFLSSSTGHDDRVAGATQAPPAADE